MMNELGLLNFCHFVDMNKEEQTHKLTYTGEIRRAETIEAKLKNLEELCFQYKVVMKQPDDVQQFLDKIEMVRGQQNVAARLMFNHIEEDVTKKEEFIVRQKQIFLNLVETYNLQLSQINIMNAFEHLMANNGMIPGTQEQEQTSGNMDALGTPLL